MHFLDWRLFLAEKLRAEVEITFVDGWFEDRGRRLLVAVELVEFPTLVKPSSLHMNQY